MIGSSWAVDSWLDAWADDSWNDGASGNLAGPVGPCWAIGSWNDDAWTIDSWAGGAPSRIILAGNVRDVSPTVAVRVLTPSPPRSRAERIPV